MGQRPVTYLTLQAALRTVLLALDWRTTTPLEPSLAAPHTTAHSFANLTGDYTQSNAGINDKVGAARLMYLWGIWGKNKVGLTSTQVHTLGTQYELGEQGELRMAFGYVHKRSRRSAVYATYGRIDNKGSGTRFNNGVTTTTPGGVSQGINLGLRHTF